MIFAEPTRPATGEIGAHRKQWLVTSELTTGAAALTGGVLLAARPDASLLHAKLSALTGSAFHDWRVPGLLLAALVGGGRLVSGGWRPRGGRGAAELSALAGVGLMVFEGAELGWIGPQPLEAVFAVAAATVLALALGQRHADAPR